MDFIVIGGLLVFFAVAAGYVRFCDRVVGAAPSKVSRRSMEADGSD